ncbi:MAG: site-2 protease family protein [Patescibacteria group bacterium]
MPLFEILLAIIVVILIHELGHAVAAILCGIKVLKLSVGFGPGLTFKKIPLLNEVKLGLIIFGGYTQFDNEMGQRPCWQKELVYSGGILANLLSACLFLWLAGSPLLSSIHHTFSFALSGWPALTELLLSSSYRINDFTDYFVNFLGLAGVSRLFYLYVAMISITIAMFNTLPILPLDGGQIFVTFLEKLFKKPLKYFRMVYTIFGIIFIFVIIFF